MGLPLSPLVSAWSGHLSGFPGPGPTELKGLGSSEMWGLPACGPLRKGLSGAPSCSLRPKAPMERYHRNRENIVSKTIPGGVTCSPGFLLCYPPPISWHSQPSPASTWASRSSRRSPSCLPWIREAASSKSSALL